MIFSFCLDFDLSAHIKIMFHEKFPSTKKARQFVSVNNTCYLRLALCPGLTGSNKLFLDRLKTA